MAILTAPLALGSVPGRRTPGCPRKPSHSQAPIARPGPLDRKLGARIVCEVRAGLYAVVALCVSLAPTGTRGRADRQPEGGLRRHRLPPGAAADAQCYL